jgi:hypothetical protein
MAIQPAATLSPVPEFPALSDRAAGTYNSKAYAFGTHMGGPGPFVPEINALSANVQHNAQEAVAAAGFSIGAQDAAEAARDAAADSAGAADGFSRNAAASANASAESAGAAADSDIAAAAQARLADDARAAAQGARDTTAGLLSDTLDARNDALAYRDQAEVFATRQLKGSSTTSVTPGAGAKSFVIEASRSFVAGMYLVATSASDPGTRMSGYVQTYNPGTGSLVIGVDTFAGTAAKADWVIGVAAPGASAWMTTQVITASAVAVPGVFYVLAAAGITLTVPINFAAGQAFGFGMSRGIWAANIDWQSNKLKGRSPGVMQLLSQNDSAVCRWVNATDGFMEAA